MASSSCFMNSSAPSSPNPPLPAPMIGKATEPKLCSSTILIAFREVEDAIVATQTFKNEYDARQLEVAAATNAANLSWVRYEGGLTSYLEVLDLQRSQFSAELNASQALQSHLSSIVALYKALGGGWTVPEQLAAAELD